MTDNIHTLLEAFSKSHKRDPEWVDRTLEWLNAYIPQAELPSLIRTLKAEAKWVKLSKRQRGKLLGDFISRHGIKPRDWDDWNWLVVTGEEKD